MLLIETHTQLNGKRRPRPLHEACIQTSSLRTAWDTKIPHSDDDITGMNILQPHKDIPGYGAS
jgi:hypothetical protein